jgi:ABC-type phosphate transport system substrate-binding protein
MIRKKDTSIIGFALLAALTTTPKLLQKSLAQEIAQTNDNPTFPLPNNVPSGTTVKINGSTMMNTINQKLKQGFEGKFAGTQVEVQSAGTDAALKALEEGQIDIAAVARSLTNEETAKGLEQISVNREKIAIIVSKDNSFDRNITIEQFAKIFRGEIKDWSELGGQPGAIRFIDRPEISDTRRSFRNYPVFQSGNFATGATAKQLTEDNLDEVIKELGKDGISYALIGQVQGKDGIKTISMHGTQPDNPKYPFSQPLLLVYKKDPNPGVQAFLGYATSDAGKQDVSAALAASGVAAANSSSTSNGNGSGASATYNTDNSSTNSNPTNSNSGTEQARANTSVPAETGMETGKFPWWILLFALPLALVIPWLFGKKKQEEEETPIAPVEEQSMGNFPAATTISSTTENIVPDSTNNNIAATALGAGLGATTLSSFLNKERPEGDEELTEIQIPDEEIEAFTNQPTQETEESWVEETIEDVFDVSNGEPNLVDVPSEPSSNLGGTIAAGAAAIAGGLGAASLLGKDRESTDSTPPTEEPENNLMGNLWDKVTDTANNAKDKVSELVEGGGNKVAEVSSTAQDAATNLLDTTKAKIDGVTTPEVPQIDNIGDAVNTAKDKAAELVEGGGNKVAEVTGTAQDAATNLIDTTKAKIDGVTTPEVPQIDNIGDAVNTAKDKAAELVEGGMGKVAEVTGTAQDAAGNLGGTIAASGEALIGGLGSILGGDSNSSETTLPIGDTTAQEDSWIDGVLGKVGDLTSGAKERATDLAQGATDSARDLAANLPGNLGDAGSPIQEGIANLSNAINNVTEPATQKTSNWTEDLFEQVSNLAKAASGKATDLTQSASETVANVAESAVEGAAEASQTAQNLVENAGQTINELTDENKEV